MLLDAPESIKNLKIKEVEDLIAAIGKVTADSGAAITAAEKKYNALSEVEKASVKNAKTIEEAKKQLTAAIKEKGKKLLSSFKKDADAVTGNTFYYPRTMRFYGEYWAADIRCFALPYIGVKGDSTWLRFLVNYTGDNWVFFEKIIFSVDGENTTKYFSYYDVTRDNGGGDVWEYVDIPVGDSEIELLREIADSKTTIVRFQGDDYRHDFTITQADKNAIKEILLAYDSLTAE